MQGARAWVLLTLAVFVATACGGGGGGGLPPGGGQGVVSGRVFVDEGVRVFGLLGEPPPPKGAAAPPRARYVPDEVVIKVRTFARAGELQPVHRQLGARVVREEPALSAQLVKLPADVSVEQAIEAYRKSPLVAYAEPNYYVYAQQLVRTPNDELFPVQWHYPMIGLPQAWATTVGAPVLVAVLDTGVRFDHPDLLGVFTQGYDFFDDDPDPTDPGCPLDPNDASHGTHVAGTIAALTNNRIGVAGVAWGGAAGVRIIPVRVLGNRGQNCGVGSNFMVAAGIRFAADRGAKVINLSLGGPSPAQILEEAVAYALSRGVTLVAAAGNEDAPVGYPAAYPGVIAVSAVGCNRVITYYSNFGPEIWVAAPGGNVRAVCGDPNTRWVWSTAWSPAAGNTYLGFQGTSMATPHVAGVAALLAARGFTTPQAIRERLAQTADDLGLPGRDNLYGYGLVNAARAVGAEHTALTLRVFTASAAPGSVQRLSSMVRVLENGQFQISDSATGMVSVVGWQDFNGNGRIDAGDVYGRVDGISVQPGFPTVGIQLRLQLYTGAPISVTRAP